MEQQILQALTLLRGEIVLLVEAVKNANANPPEIKIPEIKVPDITIPEIKVPEIKMPPFPPYPKMEFPKFEMPKIEFPKQEAPVVNVAPPDLSKIKFPTEVTVKGLEKLISKFNDTTEKLEFPKEIRIANLKDITFPEQPKIEIPPFPQLPNLTGIAKDTSIQEVITKLTEVVTALGEIEIDAESVNLNVDELEARIGALTDSPATGNGSLNAILKKIRDLLTTGISATDTGVQTAITDQLNNYQVADVDKPITSVNYYGFLDKEGNWYILKEDKSANPNTYRFVKGTGSGAGLRYETATTGAWATRASLTYDYFHNVF